jgi:hypothetical protein
MLDNDYDMIDGQTVILQIPNMDDARAFQKRSGFEYNDVQYHIIKRTEIEPTKKGYLRAYELKVEITNPMPPDLAAPIETITNEDMVKSIS